MNLSIRSPEKPDEWQQYYYLRWRILRAPWGQPEGSEKDELESTSIHLAAFENNQVIRAVARLHKTSDKTGQIRYMAVDDQWQQLGIGHKLLSAIENSAINANIEAIELNARENALNFYTKAGYELIEKSHLLYNAIQHYRMKKMLI